MPKQQHPREFKDKVVNYYRANTLSVPEVAKRFNLKTTTVRYFLKNAPLNNEPSKTPMAKASAAAQIATTELIGRVKKAIDDLEKAVPELKARWL
jgi:transposase-like protein